MKDIVNCVRIDDNTLVNNKSQSIMCEKPTILQNKNEQKKNNYLNLSKLKPIHN